MAPPAPPGRSPPTRRRPARPPAAATPTAWRSRPSSSARSASSRAPAASSPHVVPGPHERGEPHVASRKRRTSFERRGWDSNPRDRANRPSDFQDRRIRPLCHPSGEAEGSRFLLRRRPQPDRAGDAGAAQAAVAVRVLVEVLLVVGLGVVERAGGRDLGRDLAEPGRGQRRLVALARRLDRRLLLLRAVVDGRAVLGADVVALPHALRRVVALPEGAQHVVERDLRGIEDDEHGLRVPARVADRGRVDAFELPEQPLGAPEAAHPDHELLHLLGERRLERRAEDVVALRHGDRGLAPGERAIGIDHLRLLAEQDHDARLALRAYLGVTAIRAWSEAAFTLATDPVGAPGSRRGGRVAEGTRLLSEYGEAISIAGSNPALSAGGGYTAQPLSMRP